MVLKERWWLARETPLNLGHLRNMQRVTQMGEIIFPPVPALYQRPQSADEIVTHSVARALDLFGFDAELIPRWGEGKLTQKHEKCTNVAANLMVHFCGDGLLGASPTIRESNRKKTC